MVDFSKMTPELLSSLAGIILSLIFSYVPTLNVLFASKTPQTKRLIMLGLIVVVGAGIGGLSCANVLTAIPCTQVGWMSILQSIITVAIANQAMYAVTPLPAVVIAAAKAAADRPATPVAKP